MELRLLNRNLAGELERGSCPKCLENVILVGDFVKQRDLSHVEHCCWCMLFVPAVQISSPCLFYFCCHVTGTHECCQSAVMLSSVLNSFILTADIRIPSRWKQLRCLEFSLSRYLVLIIELTLPYELFIYHPESFFSQVTLRHR